MFFILDTADRLGFTDIFKKIEPQSPQGKRVKKAVEPFGPDQEEAFDQMTERLKFWSLLLKKDPKGLKELWLKMSELHSINGILERLADGETLDEGEFFEIKANLVMTRKVWEQIGPIQRLWKRYPHQAEEELDDLGASVEEEKVDLTELANLSRFIQSNLRMFKDEPIFKLAPLGQLWKILNPREVETDRFYLDDAYDPDLANVREAKNHLQAELRKYKKEAVKELEERLGRLVPASGEVMVSKMDQSLLDWLEGREDLYLQKETFSAYFYKWSPDEKYQSLENHLNLLEVEEEQVTKRVLADLTQKISKFLHRLQQNQLALGELDWILARVIFAHQHNCLPAQRITGEKIRIKQGRHLLVEAEVQERENEYTPIDLMVTKGVTLITGSNMGGKTLNLRMIGLLVAMAQHGICVPAQSMEFNLRDFIYFSVDDDQTKGDLSTFGQEIVGLNQALPRKREAGLLLMDELARGTNPEEGSALGKAMIRSLQDSNSITVMTTHFSPLTHVKGVRHLKVVGLDQDKYIYLKKKYNQDFSLKLINQLMDYRLVEVEGKEEVSQDAIRVASLLGLDESIIIDAQNELKRARKND